MLMPYSVHAEMTSASAMLPPGCAIEDTPNLEAWSMESRKGKNASLDKETPVSVSMNALFSASVKGSG